MAVDEMKNQSVRKTPVRTSQRRRWAAIMMIGSALSSFSGCTAWTGAQNAWQYNHYWNDTMMGYRQRTMATKAWHSRKHCYANQRYLKEFARGFKAGYMDVAAGGNGCTPAFPPREYWGWNYQSREGQARVSAWFSGYPYGAQAAEQEGVGNWTQIQTSRSIQNEYVNHGRMPSDFNGIYPVPPINPYLQGSTAGRSAPDTELIESSVIESSVLGQPSPSSGPISFDVTDDAVPAPGIR
jgi:hypothetical protein